MNLRRRIRILAIGVTGALFLPSMGFAMAGVPRYSEREASGLRVAVYPVENLSGARASLHEIRSAMGKALSEEGIEVLEEGVLEGFMARHRIRYTGGVEERTAEALKKELGVAAVLLTTVEGYSEINPPKIAIHSRWVSTGPPPAILWTEGIGLAGDDAPGLLGLGLIEDPKALTKKATQGLLNSLARHLSGAANDQKERSIRARFGPRIAYGSPLPDSNRTYRVVVLPFLNRSSRRYAGEILSLHFIREFRRFGPFETIEPGRVRQHLLGRRIILEDGVSLAHADGLLDGLEADLLVHGRVMEYQDFQGGGGSPRVDFSTMIVEREGRQVVWASTSHNTGNDGVLLFDWGKVNTAHALASRMVRAIVAKIAGKGTNVEGKKADDRRPSKDSW